MNRDWTQTSVPYDNSPLSALKLGWCCGKLSKELDPFPAFAEDEVMKIAKEHISKSEFTEEMKTKYWETVLTSTSAEEAMLKLKVSGLFEKDHYDGYPLKELIDAVYRRDHN